jgi:hypothetical protein
MYPTIAALPESDPKPVGVAFNRQALPRLSIVAFLDLLVQPIYCFGVLIHRGTLGYEDLVFLPRAGRRDQLHLRRGVCTGN